MANETIADVDPHGFYTIAAACRILRISRAAINARIDTINRDMFGRIPGHEVLRMAGVDWQVELSRKPKPSGDPLKRLRALV